MNCRTTSVMLCFFLGISLFVIDYLSLNGIGEDGEPKVSVDHAKLSSSQDSFKKIVKTIGDVEARLQALENTMDRIVKEKTGSRKHEATTMPNEVNTNMDSVFGEIMRGENCFDSAEHGDGGEIIVMPCHKKGGNQFFIVKDGEIKHKNFCLSVEKPESGVTVVLKDCDQGDWIQEWQYHDHIFQAAESGYCMENKGKGAVKLEQCNPEIMSQQWYTQR